jgi:hypothetical protein
MKDSKVDNKLLKLYQLGGYTPTQLQQFNYVPTYVGQPLETQRAVGDKMLDLFNTNLAQATAVDIMNAQRKAVPGDEDLNKEVAERYKNDLAAIAKSGDYENMTMRINALARRYQTDPDILALTESRANWDQEQAMVRDVRMKTGRDPLFIQNPAAHRTVGYDENGKKTFNIYRSTAEAPLDWQKTRQNIWSVIEPNMGPLSQEEVRKALTEIPGYFATGIWKGIGSSKIRNLLEEAISAYEGTPEYRQEFRYIRETQNLTPEAADQEIKARIFKEGLLKTFHQTDPQYLKDWILEEQMENAGKAMPEVPSYEGMPAVKIKTILGFDADDFDVKQRTEPGRLPGKNTYPPIMDPSVSGGTYTGQRKGITDSEKEARNSAALAGAEIFGGPNVAKQAAEMGSNFYDTPQAQAFAKQYQDFITTRYQFPKVQPYPEDISKSETFQLRNFLNNRMVLDLDNPDGGTVPTSKGGSLTPEFLEMIGGKANNLTVSGYVTPKNSYGKLSGNPMFGDAQVVTMTDEKNNTHKQMLITRPEGYYKTGEGQSRKILNTLWNNLALNPGKLQRFNVEGLELEAKTIPTMGDVEGSQDQILVYKIGPNDYSDSPVAVPSYETLLSIMLKLQQ